MINPPCGGDPGAATGDCPVFKGVPCHAGRAGTDHHRSGDRISAWTSDTASWNHRIYGVENPGYHKIARIYENMKVEYAKISLDKDGISVRELEEKCVDVIHTSPSHHFPTGIVMPVSRRYELLGWAAKSPDHYIIEDDYDSELRLTGKPFPTRAEY